MGKIQLKREYLSNRMIDLKRAGLINLDIDLLTRIQRYENDLNSRSVYYSRISEDSIRDKDGLIIDTDSLPFRRWESFNHFIPIEGAKRYNEWMKKPGNLYNKMDQKYDERDTPIFIYEVPDETEFPLPDNFDWMKHCLNWLKQVEHDFKFENVRRLNGIETNYIFSHASPKDSLRTLVFISVNQFTDSEIQEMVEEISTKKGNYELTNG